MRQFNKTDKHTQKSKIHNEITKLAAAFNCDTLFCKCCGKVNVSNKDRKNNMVRKYTLYIF